MDAALQTPAPKPAEPFSESFREILRFCSDLRPPFTSYDIHALVALYRCVRGGLDARERRHVTRILDLMRLTTPPEGLIEPPPPRIAPCLNPSD